MFDNLDFNRSQWHNVVMKIEQRPQTQMSLNVQLAKLYFVANRLGLYDAADFIRYSVLRNE